MCCVAAPLEDILHNSLGSNVNCSLLLSNISESLFWYSLFLSFVGHLLLTYIYCFNSLISSCGISFNDLCPFPVPLICGESALELCDSLTLALMEVLKTKQVFESKMCVFVILEVNILCFCLFVRGVSPPTPHHPFSFYI